MFKFFSINVGIILEILKKMAFQFEKILSQKYQNN